jgi:pimeloyl-ACP methyl ester carboxylesterase
MNRSNREPLDTDFVDSVWRHFDHGTQRAILKLYRSAPSGVLAQAGSRLGTIDCPVLVVHGRRDPFIPVEFAQRYADAVGGDATVRVVDDAGHWPWLDEPDLIEEIADFVTRPAAAADQPSAP